MSEHSTTLPSEAWGNNKFWDRVCSGFQSGLCRVWSEEQQDALPDGLLLAWPQTTKKEVPPASESETVAQDFSWTLVLSDTGNDFQSVLQALWLTGLCDRNGCWVPGLRNIQIVHTGDWLNKWHPNPHVLDGFKRLQETTPKGCKLVLLNGNHELSILQMHDKGLRMPLTTNDLSFIRKQNLIHTSKEALFLHGYPSSDLLMILKKFHQENVRVEDFNKRLWKVFFDGSSPLFREPRSSQIIGDIKNPKSYFNQRSRNGIHRGQYTASTLQRLGFETVIHGHKPNDRVQLDYELSEEIPGIRMINNDNRIRQSRFGGLLLSDQGYTVFINPETLQEAGSSKILRKKIRRLLRTRRKDLHPKKMRQKQAKMVARIAA